MKTIPLTQGYVTVVDDADFPLVSPFNWCVLKRNKGLHAARTVYSGGGKKTVYLHLALMPGVSRVDHRDGDGLNNRRENLRPATHSQNMRGFKRKKNGATSKFRGVVRTESGKWRAIIRVNGTLHDCGRFASEEAAARAYDTAAHRFFGEFASPNFPAVAGK